MKNINFNKEEKDAIIYVMKFRVESITSGPNWSSYPKNWKNEHYQPLRTSKWKIEGNKTNFLNSELINMESCLNEYSPTEN
ncbi:hypothetical protein [Psychroserpens burtonensis]|uniref:hypothetical protein n=1 Tax=Psychroserpens burtonensis TaxID=49278 RepID=UPI00041DD48C|nr:hypothetical protein [Psychroserpens burtonensis]